MNQPLDLSVIVKANELHALRVQNALAQQVLREIATLRKKGDVTVNNLRTGESTVMPIQTALALKGLERVFGVDVSTLAGAAGPGTAPEAAETAAAGRTEAAAPNPPRAPFVPRVVGR